ncbi:MAG: SH3 domain-containing protein [Spirochaetes bacterium]|jgi:uncharacterized protein YgiM (DUF1202 family)|nr:SH3 domain-containing protein [Spirochaetota bacterium]
MTLKKLYLAIIMITLAAFGCKDDDPKKFYADKSAVILSGNTAIRVDPIIFSSKITQLKKGETVEVLEKSFEKSWIGNSSDFWYKIKLRNGVTGWVFGKNIKILSSKADSSVKNYVASYMSEESEKIKKELNGKWWSVNQFGDYTENCLEMTKDGKYKSYLRGVDPKATEGEYTIDFNKNEITFSKGATFGNTIEFSRRGTMLFLKKDLEDHELRLKKISEEALKKEEEKTEVQEKPENPPPSED